MQKPYLYLMVCVIGAMSLASSSEDSISPDAGGDGLDSLGGRSLFSENTEV